MKIVVLIALLLALFACTHVSATSSRAAILDCVKNSCSSEDSITDCYNKCTQKVRSVVDCVGSCRGLSCIADCMRSRREVEQQQLALQRAEEEEEVAEATVSRVRKSAATNAVITIGSFNIQVFGQRKMSDAKVVDVLLKILARYDIVLIQEIRDSSDTAIHALLEKLKAATGKDLGMSISERLGRTNSKEQYAFVYDKSKITVLKEYQYPDPKNFFERPPYSVLIQVNASNKKMMLTGVHISPGTAVQEIDNLVDVYEYYADQYGIKTVMRTEWIVMGDMNADCGYLSKSKWGSIRLRTDKSFTWLIEDGINTTVAKSVCAYDRFVTTKSVNSAWLKSVSAFDYAAAYKLSATIEKKVSDHFPIELTIDTSA